MPAYSDTRGAGWEQDLDRQSGYEAGRYRTQGAQFPPECKGSDYENRILAAFPIHPEIFDRLYTDWFTLVKFQRTRGVLRLMAAVIHSLWEKGDRNPLILPSTITIDDTRVQSELTRYLSDNWVPIIEKDVEDRAEQLSVTLEIAVSLPDGASEQIVRIVTENSRTLKFTSHGFEHDADLFNLWSQN